MVIASTFIKSSRWKSPCSFVLGTCSCKDYFCVFSQVKNLWHISYYKEPWKFSCFLTSDKSNYLEIDPIQHRSGGLEIQSNRGENSGLSASQLTFYFAVHSEKSTLRPMSFSSWRKQHTNPLAAAEQWSHSIKMTIQPPLTPKHSNLEVDKRLGGNIEQLIQFGYSKGIFHAIFLLSNKS